MEATTLIEHSVSYKKNHVVQYSIAICFWIVSIEQLYRLLGKCAFYGHLNLKMQLLESLIVLNFEIHAAIYEVIILYQLEHSIAEPAQVISHFTYTWFSIQKLTIIIMYLVQLPNQITTQ